MLVHKRLLALSLGHRGRLAAVTAVLCVLTASYWLQAWFLAQGLAVLATVGESGAGGRQAFETVTPLLAGVLGCGLFRLLLQQLHSRLAASLGAAVRHDLRQELARRLLSPGRLHDVSERYGARRLALTDGVDGVDSYIGQYIPHAVQLQLLCPVLLLGMAFFNPILAGVLSAAVVMAVGAPRLWGRLLAHRGKQHWDSYEGLSADYLEALQGMGTLKILHAVPRVRGRLRDRSGQLHRATVAAMRTSLADTALADFGIQAGLLSAAVLASLSAIGAVPSADGGDAASVYLMLLLSSEVFRPVRDLARQWHAAYLGLSALGRIDAAAGGKGADAPTSAVPAVVANSRTAGQPRILAIDEVSFRYSEGAPWLLKGATAEIRSGGITALAGASGAGKSTLFDLLLGFIPSCTGGFRLDGGALLPEHISVVSQRSYLFPGTIRANLQAVAPDIDDDGLQEVLRRAGLREELRRWSAGLDTVLSESGRSVSGGQRQRLAVARALAADRPVLLLDEATSALNPALAAEVMEGIKEYARDRIVLMIAHRPEALAAADTVLHLSGGSLREVSPDHSFERAGQ